MRVCKDLGLTLEQGMEMSVLEFKLWVAFYNLEQKEAKGQMQDGRRKHNRKDR